MSDFQDGVLPLSQFLKVRVHLFNCPGCRALLATLRALPPLASSALHLAPDRVQGEAHAVLQSALARMAQPGYRRAWAATPVPQEARRALEADPDLPMRLLASTHALIAGDRTPPPPPYRLPQATLDQLPAADCWIWQERRNGGRRAELFGEAGGVRLVLMYTPPNSVLPPHRHLGSESILVLDGGMDDQGRDFGRGDWIHYPEGSCHAPRVAPTGCWCLIREEGSVRFLGPAGWLRHLRDAS
jgi:anti-sigma factor ChrR (cupin superfamily)